ncbi:hypothetical protein V565_057920, partial [Rhizoctonia solani 123E]
MSRHKSQSPESDVSELEDALPSASNTRSRAAILRELKKRVHNQGLGVALAQYPGMTAEKILGPRPAKRRRIETVDPPATLNERIDAIKVALEQNNLTMADFIKATCAYDYGAQREKSEKGFKLSANDAEDAEEVRTWAKQIACQELLQEAKLMEDRHLLHTGSNSSTVEGLKEWSPTTVYNHLCEHMPYLVSILKAFIMDGKHVNKSKEDEIPIV